MSHEETVQSNHGSRRLWVFIGAVSLIRVVLAAIIPLVPQEAYYWLYIQNPALGYFDHPPLCSYSIGLSTYLFGNHELFVRLPMILYSIGIMWVLYQLTLQLFSSRRLAFMVVVAINLTLFFNISAFIATPDTPLLFFWLLTVWMLSKVFFIQSRWYWWVLAGVFAGLALCSKYTASFLFISTLLYILISKYHRHYLWKPQPYLAMITAALVFSPVIYWNATHNWASFLFQSSGRASKTAALGTNYFFQLLGSQLYELTPLFFILGILAMIAFFKNYFFYHKERIFFLSSYSVPMIIFFFLISFTSLVKMNWLEPAYLTLLISIVYYYYHRVGRDQDSNRPVDMEISGKTKFGAVFSIIMIIANCAILLFPLVPIKKGDTWNGWKELSREIVQLKIQMKKQGPVFIFANEYKAAAEMAFYTPYQDIIYAQNVYGEPALQFDFRQNPQALIGHNAIFFYSDFEKMQYMESLNQVFERVEPYKTLEIIHHGKVFRVFYLFQCYNYKGVLK